MSAILICTFMNSINLPVNVSVLDVLFLMCGYSSCILAFRTIPKVNTFSDLLIEVLCHWTSTSTYALRRMDKGCHKLLHMHHDKHQLFVQRKDTLAEPRDILYCIRLLCIETLSSISWLLL